HEEIACHMDGFDDHLLWETPGGMASVGFHLQHVCGVLDRLFTYAREATLSDQQFAALRAEGQADPAIRSATLVHAFGRQVQDVLNQVREMDECPLTQPRYLGRKRITTTLLGLLLHAAEHPERHVGQLRVNVSRVSRAC